MSELLDYALLQRVVSSIDTWNLVVAIAVLFVTKYVIHRVQVATRKLPPGPFLTWPLIGESLAFFKSPSLFLFSRCDA